MQDACRSTIQVGGHQPFAVYLRAVNQIKFLCNVCMWSVLRYEGFFLHARFAKVYL